MSGVVKDFKISRGLFRGKELLRAVDNVSLSVEQGEVLAIVGESGCGKTTLARIILGLLNPDQGTVEIDGRPILGFERRELARLRTAYFPRSLLLIKPTKNYWINYQSANAGSTRSRPRIVEKKNLGCDGSCWSACKNVSTVP